MLIFIVALSSLASLKTTWLLISFFFDIRVSKACTLQYPETTQPNQNSGVEESKIGISFTLFKQVISKFERDRVE